MAVLFPLQITNKKKIQWLNSERTGFVTSIFFYVYTSHLLLQDRHSSLCYFLMLKGSMNNSAPLPFLLCCIPIELPEQSCINKFWLILLLQFHAWHSLRYIQSKIKERKYLYKSFYEISHACNKPISPELKWIVKMSLQSLDQANTAVLQLCPPVWGWEFRTTMKLQSTVGADFKGHEHISMYVHK